MHTIVLQSHDRASQATAGRDLVASLELIKHSLPLFLPPLLGKNQKKIKDAEDKDQRGYAEPSHATTTAELQRRKICHIQEVRAV